MNDPIVDEVHRARQRIFDECGRDIRRLMERLREASEKHEGQRVTLEQVRQMTRGSAKRE